MKSGLVILLALMLPDLATADSAVVLGRLVGNEPMEYVKDECPENAICLRSWWKSVVEVQKTISGPHLAGRVAAANLQHTSLNSRYTRKVRLFVLKPITDAAERAKLRVDYYLEEMSLPTQMYCFSQDPRELGLDVTETYVSGTDDKTYCFELPSG
jgi:hypothetical protein